MSDLRKAAEQALEALNTCGPDDTGSPSYDGHLVISAINALHAALAAPPQRAVTKLLPRKLPEDNGAALDAPPQAEPVGVAEPMPGTSGFTLAVFPATTVPAGTKLYAAPQQAEPAVRLPFVIEDRAGHRILDWSKRGGAGCRAATEPECQMWDALVAAMKAAPQQTEPVVTDVMREAALREHYGGDCWSEDHHRQMHATMVAALKAAPAKEEA